MYRTVVTICTTSLTLTILLSAHTAVFMCFVWISEQTAIISLYNINWLVFITETVCVYCAVRNEFLSKIQVNFLLKTVSRLRQCHRPHTTEVRVQSQGSPVGLPPVPWTEKTIERSPFFVRRGGHCCRRNLVGQTTFWIFLSGLQKLEQRAKKCIELRGECVEWIPSLVAVAYFLPCRAKDLSAPPRSWGHVVSTWCLPVQVQKQTQYWIWPESPADKLWTAQHRTLLNTTDTTKHSHWL